MTEGQEELNKKKKFIKSIEKCFHKLDLDEFESKINHNGNWFRGWILPNGKLILTISHYDLMNSNLNGGMTFEIDASYKFYELMIKEYGLIRLTMAKNWIKEKRQWDAAWSLNIHCWNKWTKNQSDTIYKMLKIDMFTINIDIEGEITELSCFDSYTKAWNYLNNRVEAI